MSATGLLVLVRHGQSQWNQENRFTGWQDVPLTAKGKEQAKAGAQLLRQRGVQFDRAFVSTLGRAKETCALLLAELGQAGIPCVFDPALRERDYGTLTGLNKAQAAKQFGAQQIKRWRRNYEDAPPEGESLKDTKARVLPYYRQAILPCLKAGEQVLICAHGNSLRGLIMELEGLLPQTIPSVELATGEVWLYPVDSNGVAGKRETLSV